MAATYVQKWLGRPALGGSTLLWQAVEWLEALSDWAPVPADALPAPPGR